MFDVLKDLRARTGEADTLEGRVREALAADEHGKPRRDAGLAQAERAWGMRPALFVNVDRNMSNWWTENERTIGSVVERDCKRGREGPIVITALNKFGMSAPDF